jgi:hypothetical protein
MMNPEKLSRAAARKAFNAARDEAKHALTSLVEAPSGWDVECRGDAVRSLKAMMAAARTKDEILEVVAMRGFLLQTAKGKLRACDP